MTRTGTSRPYFRRSCGSKSTSISSNATPSARSSAAICSHKWQPRRPYSLTLIGEPGDRHERRALAAPDLKRDDRVLVQAGKQLVELLDRPELGVLTLVYQGKEHVALAHVGLGVGPHLGDDQAVREAQSFLLLGGKLADDDPEPVRRRLGLRLGTGCWRVGGNAVLLQLGHGDVELARLAFAPHVKCRLRAGARGADEPRQVARALDRLAVERDDDVCRLHAGLVRGAALLH